MDKIGACVLITCKSIDAVNNQESDILRKLNIWVTPPSTRIAEGCQFEVSGLQQVAHSCDHEDEQKRWNEQA